MFPADLALTHPRPAPPRPGEAVPIADGVLWARLPLPGRLDHVNVYLLEDAGGWAVLDTGLDDRPTRAAWERLLAGPLGGRPLTQLLVSHAHLDHVGLAGWFAGRFGLQPATSEAEWLGARLLQVDPGALEGPDFEAFYAENGLDADAAEALMGRGRAFAAATARLPAFFRRIAAGDTLLVGGRGWRVLAGGGHAPEHVLLHDPAGGLLLSGDHVLPRMAATIGVSPRDPHGDPLGLFARSLDELRADLASDTLVLPGHDLPFVGLHARIETILAHHAARSDAVAAACRDTARDAAELAGLIGPAPRGPRGRGFAFLEMLAYANGLVRSGRLRVAAGRDGLRRFST